MCYLWWWKHDVALVYEVQKAILTNLKCKVPGLSTIIYFTDECAGQYKNWGKKIIIFVRTKVILEWMGDEYFLSLVMVMWWNEMWYDLLPPSDMFQFCKENIQNTTFKFIYKIDGDNTRVILNERFEGVTWIPGTRSFHEFSKIDQYSIEMKRTSEDKEPSKFRTLKIKQNKVLLFKY